MLSSYKMDTSSRSLQSRRMADGLRKRRMKRRKRPKGQRENVVQWDTSSEKRKRKKRNLLRALILLILIKLTFVQLTVESEAFIKVTRFVVPPVARVGDTVRLLCAYELSGETLHAMKLFKDDKEFYRYLPGETGQQKLAFKQPGINVDQSRSNDREVYLRNVDKQSAGQYKCQVLIEDTFKSISVERKLEIQNRSSSSPAQIAAAGLNPQASNMFAASATNGNNQLIGNRQQQRHAVHQQAAAGGQSSGYNHQQAGGGSRYNTRGNYGFLPAQQGASMQHQGSGGSSIHHQQMDAHSSGAISVALSINSNWLSGSIILLSAACRLNLRLNQAQR